MELAWLQDFVALREAGSFSRAAGLRNVTQPAFSRRVRALEHWAGARLFERSSTGVRLTAAGKTFSRGAGELLAQANTLRARTREAGENATGALRFAATQTLSFTFFPDWIRRIGGFDLGLVQISAGNMAACHEILARGDADFLLCHWHERAVETLGGRLEYRSVGSDAMVRVGSPALATERGRPFPRLDYDRSSALGRIVSACERRDDERGERTPVFSSHLAAALRSLAIDGEGSAWLPLALVRDDLDAGRLVRLAPETEDISVEIRLYLAPTATESARRFWSRLEEERRVVPLA